MRTTGLRYPILAVLLFYLLLPLSISAEIKEASPIEVEDRDLIHHLLEDKYYVYAREEAEAYLEKYPEGIFRAEIQFVLAEIAVTNNALKKALSYYNAILDQHPDSDLFEDSLYLSGILHLRLNQSSQGREKLRRLIKQYPQSRFLFRTYLKLGELAFKENNWTTAAVYLETTVKNGDLKPAQQLEARNYLAWTYYFQKKTEEAHQLFLELLKSDLPSEQKTKIAYQLAIDAQQKKDYPTAISWHKQVMEKWPHPDFTDKSRFWIAESLFLMHQSSKKGISKADKKRAIRLYSQNLRLKNPVESENSHYHRGWFLLDLGQQTAAEKDFAWLQSRNKRYGKNIELTIIRARYYESKSNWRKANRIYRSALKLQDDAESKNELLTGIIRNDFQQKNCKQVIASYEKISLPAGKTTADEILYYTGTCYHQEKQFKKAESVLRRINLTSRFAILSFDYYMDTLRQNNKPKSGLQYLKKIQNVAQFQDRERILLYQTEFQLDLELWFQALKTMKELVSVSPGKKKDPWFLLNVAQTLDQVVLSMKNSQWRSQRPTLKSEDYYRKQAIIYYRESYKYMPLEQTAVRLSILEILIQHHEAQKAWKTLSYQYNTAIQLSRDERQKDRFAYRLANIMIKLGENSDKIIRILETVHGRANLEVNYKASALLAELYIKKQNYEAAIDTLIDLARQPIDKTPWFSKVHFRIAELYQAQEQWQPAIKHYSKVAESTLAASLKKKAQARLVKLRKFVKQLKAEKQNKQSKAK
jgi:TolA-binding protein